jgi:hypothetical protein
MSYRYVQYFLLPPIHVRACQVCAYMRYITLTFVHTWSTRILRTRHIAAGTDFKFYSVLLVAAIIWSVVYSYTFIEGVWLVFLMIFRDFCESNPVPSLLTHLLTLFPSACGCSGSNRPVVRGTITCGHINLVLIVIPGSSQIVYSCHHHPIRLPLTPRSNGHMRSMSTSTHFFHFT